MCKGKSKSIILSILILFIIIFITGCSNQPLNDNIKLKDHYKEKYSSQFGERFELLTQLSVLLYNNSLKNKYESISTLNSYRSFLDDYKNTNDKEQKEIVDNIKGFYDNYLMLATDNALDQVLKDSVEKGELESTDPGTKMKENDRKMQNECKNYLNKLMVYFN